MANIILNGKTVVTQTGNDEPLIGGNVLMHNDVLANATFPAGHVVQVFNHKTTTRASANVTGSVPGWDKGGSFTTFSFTPHYSTSKLLLTSTTINVQQSSNVGDNPWLCAVYDTTLIGSMLSYPGYVHWQNNLDLTFVSFNHLFDSWGVDTKTIDIRFGSWSSETIKCNAPSTNAYDAIPTQYHEQCFTVWEISQ